MFGGMPSTDALFDLSKFDDPAIDRAIHPGFAGTPIQVARRLGARRRICDRRGESSSQSLREPTSNGDHQRRR